MQAMNDSGIEWIGQIPQEWKVVLLSSIFNEHKQKNTDLLCSNLLSLSYGKIIKKNISTADGLLPVSFEGYNIVNKNDIVLRLTDLQNDQRSLRTGLVTEKIGIITSAYVTLRLYASNIASAKYMHYFLYAFDISKGFYGMGDGVRQSLNYDGCKKIQLLFPPLPEQQRIADYLDKQCSIMDKLAEILQQQIEKLREYKQSVITEAVTKGLDPNVAMKDSGIEWIGEIPAWWKIEKAKYTFAQRSERGNNISLQLLSPTQNFGVIPQVKYDALTGMKSVKLHEGIELHELKTIHKGDFCISLRSFQGGFEYSIYEGVVSPAYRVFYATKQIVEKYYKYLFKSVAFIQKICSYTTSFRDGKAISFEAFANSLIPLPPLPEQQRIANYLDKKCEEIDKLIKIKQEKIDKLSEYKKSLIYECVTGKREVAHE